MRRKKRLPSSSHLLAFPPRAWIYTYVIVQAFPMFIVPAGDTLLNRFSSSKTRKGTVAGKERKGKVPESSTWRRVPAAESGDVFSPLKGVCHF